jgi:hypothetical protein
MNSEQERDYKKTDSIFLMGMRNTTKNLTKITHTLAEIRVKHFQNIIQRRCR